MQNFDVTRLNDLHHQAYSTATLEADVFRGCWPKAVEQPSS